MLMLSILLFIERRKLEIRGPVLNFEISDSSIVPLAEGSANAQFPESCTSKFKTGPRISNFLLSKNSRIDNISMIINKLTP